MSAIGSGSTDRRNTGIARAAVPSPLDFRPCQRRVAYHLLPSEAVPVMRLPVTRPVKVLPPTVKAISAPRILALLRGDVHSAGRDLEGLRQCQLFGRSLLEMVHRTISFAFGETLLTHATV